jgi:hypothetical protein
MTREKWKIGALAAVALIVLITIGGCEGLGLRPTPTPTNTPTSTPTATPTDTPTPTNTPTNTPTTTSTSTPTPTVTPTPTPTPTNTSTPTPTPVPCTVDCSEGVTITCESGPVSYTSFCWNEASEEKGWTRRCEVTATFEKSGNNYEFDVTSYTAKVAQGKFQNRVEVIVTGGVFGDEPQYCQNY